MKDRGSRNVGTAAVVLAVLALALAASPALGASGSAAPRLQQLGAARSGPIKSGSGIVQAVRADMLIVRQLDGRRLRVPVGPATVVFVNGVRSSLAAVQPGWVVTFKGRAGRPALVIRASGGAAPAPSTPKAGTVQSVSADAVVVSDGSGGTVIVAVGGHTRVFLNGSPASISDIVPGDQLDKVAGGGGQQPAQVLRFRRPS